VSRKFAVTAPNQVWCGDVSFIWTGKRWAYLAVVIDLFARQPVGWAMSHSPDSNLTCQALTIAKHFRQKLKQIGDEPAALPVAHLQISAKSKFSGRVQNSSMGPRA
jgi:transposase InsO family protein